MSVAPILFASSPGSINTATNGILAADDALVLLTPSGLSYSLVRHRLGLRFLPAKGLELAKLSPFQKLERKSAGGHLLLLTGDRRQVLVRSEDGQSYRLAPIKASAENQVFLDAHTDSLGNFLVELGGGDHTGFHYFSADGEVVALAGLAGWRDDAQPEFIQIRGNPYGSGFIGLDMVGALWKINPPTVQGDLFSVDELAPRGSVHDFNLVGEHIFIYCEDGRFGYLRDESAVQTSLEEIQLPTIAKQKLPLSMLSASEPYSGQKLIDLLQQRRPRILQSSIIDQLASLPNARVLLSATRRVLTDEVESHYLKDELDSVAVWGRDQEVRRVMRTLVFEKGKTPILVGQAGSGKTAIADLLAQKLFFNDIPEARIFQKELTDAIVIETTPSRISSVDSSPSAAVEQFVRSVLWTQSELKRNIIVYVDEIHSFKKEQLEALKTAFDRIGGIYFLGATTFGEFTMMSDLNPALKRRLVPIYVPELSIAETKDLLQKTVVPRLQKRYAGADRQLAVITDGAIDAALRLSSQYAPDVARPESPYKLLMAALVWKTEKSGALAATLDSEDVGSFLAEELHMPINPADPVALVRDLDALRQSLNGTVIDNPNYVDAMINAATDVYLSSEQKDSISVIYAAGPTGAGKSYGARQFAKALFGSEERVLEIDLSNYVDGGSSSKGTLIGVGRGIVSGTETKGLIPDFLLGRGRGANVIILNEIDKAHGDIRKILMEMFDKGVLQGGSGESFTLGKSVIILTSNRGSDFIYPRNLSQPLSREEISARSKRLNKEELIRIVTQPSSDNLYDASKVWDPAFVNRIDYWTAVFPPSIEGAQMAASASARSKEVETARKYGWKMQVDDSILTRLVSVNYNPENGLRNIHDLTVALLNQVIVKLIREGHRPKRGAQVNLSLDPKEPATVMLRVDGDDHLLMTLRSEALDVPSANPLEDKKLRQELLGYEDRLNSLVFGQQAVIKRVADSLKHRRFRASNKGLGEARAKRARRSVDIFAFLGSTGTGKTELAEAIAEVYYGHRSRAVRFDMGSIKNGDQLSDIFGSPRGYVGSNTRPPFEEALVTFGREGGVIIFDEFDKIGGGAKSGIPSSARDQFLNGLYSITDKAEWRSPLGKVYDLSHVIFVFTANAGQELTQGLLTDDLRLSAWESANDEQSLEAILRESGWQEALVGRLRGSMFLFKPLTQTYKDDIAKKEIGRVLEDFGPTIGLDDVAFHPEFLKILNDAFFSHSSGARSMNLMIKKTIPALLTEVLSSDVDLTSGRDMKFRFTLSDNYHGVYSFSGARPPKRSVLLTLDLIKADGAESAFTRDVSHFANKKVLRSVQDMRRTAFHEAGHVVANDVTLTNKGFDFVTIVGAGDFLGYARFKTLDHAGPLSRDAIVASVASLLAGRAAEMMMGFSPDAGWSSDWEQARLTAVTAIKKYGLVDDPLSLRFDADGAIIMNDPKVQSAIEAILTDAQDFALKRLKAQWPAVHMLAMRLLQKHSISRDEIDSILAYAGSDKHRIDLGNAAKAQIPQPRVTLNHSCSSAFKTRKPMD